MGNKDTTTEQQIETRLRAELAEVDQLIAASELQSQDAREHLRRAEAAAAQFAAPAGQRYDVSTIEGQQAAGVVKSARRALHSADDRQQALQRVRDRITKQLESIPLREAALAEWQRAETELEQARDQLAAAEQRVAQLGQMLEAEIEADQAAAEADGAAVLAAVKSGADAAAALPTRTSKVQPLRIAKQVAEREVEEARAVVARAQAARQKAELATMDARADFEELLFREAEELFVKAAARCMAARARAKRPGIFLGPYQGRAEGLMEAELLQD